MARKAAVVAAAAKSETLLQSLLSCLFSCSWPPERLRKQSPKSGVLRFVIARAGGGLLILLYNCFAV